MLHTVPEEVASPIRIAMSRGGLYYEADRALVEAPTQQLVAAMLFCRALVPVIPLPSDDQRLPLTAMLAWVFLSLFPASQRSTPSDAMELLGCLGLGASSEA